MIELRDSTVVIMNGAESVTLYNGNNEVGNFDEATNFPGTIALFDRIRLGDGELYAQDPATNIRLNYEYQVRFDAPGIEEEYFIYYRKMNTEDDFHPVRFRLID